MSKKKQIQIDAKIDTTEISRLDQIIGGFNEFARYGTKSEEDYTSQLLDLNRTDLEAHASKLGIIPFEDTERLRNKLLNEFRTYNSLLYRPKQTPPVLKVSEKIQKILAEGR